MTGFITLHADGSRPFILNVQRINAVASHTDGKPGCTLALGWSGVRNVDVTETFEEIEKLLEQDNSTTPSNNHSK